MNGDSLDGLDVERALKQWYCGVLEKEARSLTLHQDGRVRDFAKQTLWAIDDQTTRSVALHRELDRIPMWVRRFFRRFRA